MIKIKIKQRSEKTSEQSGEESRICKIKKNKTLRKLKTDKEIPEE